MKPSRAVVFALSVAVASVYTLDANARFGQGGGNFGGPNAVGSGGTTVSLSVDAADTLEFMREEEKLARDVYLMMDEVWNVTIFSNIADSEQKHMDAIETLLGRHGIPDPVIDEADVGGFTNPDLLALYEQLITDGEQSLLAALQVGAHIEEIDIADLREALAVELPDDVQTVYENLLQGSRNHLRAFVRQIEWQGVIYRAKVLDQEDVDAILDSPMERGSRRGKQSRGR